MRFLFYSHDSYGLGHIRRTLSVAERLLADHPGASSLVLTGAPRANFLRYPERCDYVKLPSVSKGDDGQYVARDIDLPLKQTIALRSHLIRDAAEHFEPDLLLVDHTPIGLCGEISPVIERCPMRGRHLPRVLGLRDIIDEPEAVRAAWERDGILRVLQCCYDRILVYGQREVFDPIEAYRIPPVIARKMVFTGYIARSAGTTAPQEVLSRFAPRTNRLVVVTAGGGGDGLDLMRVYIDAVRPLGTNAPFESLIVTGPLMSPRKRQRVHDEVSGLPGVTVLEHHEDIPGLYRAAGLVVAMAGYNSVSEMACAGARALLVPRCRPRKEQFLRARLLEQRGVARCLPYEDLEPGRFRREMLEALDAPPPPRRWGLDFSGLAEASRTVAALLVPIPLTARLPGHAEVRS